MGCIRGDGKTRYAVYIGDTFLVMGTAEQCAKQLGVKQLGVKPDTVRWWSSPVAMRRAEAAKKPRRVAIRL